MNKNQKIVLWVTAAILLLMLMFPPFHIQSSRRTVNMGCSCIASAPNQSTVNVGTLFIQCFIVGVVGTILCLIFQDKEKKEIAGEKEKVKEGEVIEEQDNGNNTC